MSVEDDEKEIEATKAPLMDHLIELRSRLIKALVAFGITFVGCFFLAGDIYNILIKPFAWVAGPEHTKFIYTALLEYFWTKLKLAMFGAAFISFPVVAGQIYMFVAPGLYRHERKAFLPYLIATPIFSRSALSWFTASSCRCWCASRSACSSSAARVSRKSRCCRRSANIST